MVAEQTTPQPINAFLSHIVTINISDGINLFNLPNFIIEDNDDKKLTDCSISFITQAQCKIPIGVTDGSYMIYYEGCDGTKVSTGITVEVSVETVEPTGLFLSSNEKYSNHRDAMKNLFITFTANPSYTQISYVVLERGDGIKLKYTYCYLTQTGKFSCSNPDTPPSIGKFKLVEIAGDMRYDCSKIATDFISNYAYGVPQTYQMYSHSTIPSFELYLGESQNGFTSYKVYFPTAEGTQLTCTQTGQKLSCQSATITGEAWIFLFWYCQETQKYETPISHIIRVGANIDANTKIVYVLSIQLVEPNNVLVLQLLLSLLPQLKTQEVISKLRYQLSLKVDIHLPASRLIQL